MKNAILTLAGVLGCTVAVQASPYVISNVPPVETHIDYPDFQGWENVTYFGSGPASGRAAGYGDVTEMQTVGGRDNVLEITHDGSGAPEADIVFTADTDNELIGNWSFAAVPNPYAYGFYFGMDFYADTGTSAENHPESLMFYFYSGDGGGSEWYFDLTDAAIAAYAGGPAWHYFRAGFDPFGGPAGWTSPSGEPWGPSLFSDITEVGLVLGYQEGADQIFGLSEYGIGEVPIPEPGAMMLLGGALLSLGMTFRKRIGEQVREMLPQKS